jgi:hypothetical protein
VTGAGAGPRGQCRLAACPAVGCPRGHCRLAACPGDRIPRSRILGSNHFAFPSLAAVRIGSGFRPSALPLRVAGWRANDLWPRTRHLPQPHRPIEFFANNFFDCRHRGSLAASTQVNHAPRVRQPPSIFSTYAPRLERALLTCGDGDGVLHIKISGSHSNLFCW